MAQFVKKRKSFWSNFIFKMLKKSCSPEFFGLTFEVFLKRNLKACGLLACLTANV